MRWPVAASALLALTGCGPPPLSARPALWRVQDRDTTVWLLGSIHTLPPRVAWETPAIGQAETAADTLILEIAPDDPQAASAAFRAAAHAPGLPPLRDRVAAADRGAVTRALAVAGQAPDALDGFKTWAAALVLAAGHDASVDDGVEAVMTRRFAGKAIGALETRRGQLALFDALSEPAQRALLVHAARDVLHGGDGAFAAWRRGDEAALAATLVPLKAQPALQRTLVADRNARWATAIARRMARPGRVLVVVGAGHLVGPDGVPALLRARGWRVSRIA